MMTQSLWNTGQGAVAPSSIEPKKEPAKAPRRNTLIETLAALTDTKPEKWRVEKKHNTKNDCWTYSCYMLGCKTWRGRNYNEIFKKVAADLNLMPPEQLEAFDIMLFRADNKNIFKKKD